MCMGCYFRQRKWDEARRFCEMIVADYDPKSEPCNNALFCLGITYRAQGKPKIAENSFLRMLNAPTSEKWNRVAQAQLAEVAMTLHRTLSEIEPYVAVLRIHTPTKEGGFYRYAATVQRFESYVEDLREIANQK